MKHQTIQNFENFFRKWIEFLPSFLPATNLVSDVSKKRCRELSSPTGKTPLQECKRQPASVSKYI